MKINALFLSMMLAATLTSCSSQSKSSNDSVNTDSATESTTEVATASGDEADFEGEPDSDSDCFDYDRLTKLYTADQRHLSEDDKEFLLLQYDIAKREVDGIDGTKNPAAFQKKLKELDKEEYQAVIAAISLTEGQAKTGKFNASQMARFNESKTFYTSE